MAKKIITIGKKGVTERIEGSGPVTDVNVDYPSEPLNKNAGKPIKDRLDVGPNTDKGGPFSLFEARLSSIDGSNTIAGITIDPDTNVYAALFLKDYPKIIEAKSSYNSFTGIFVENTKISKNPAFIQKIENANYTKKSSFNSNSTMKIVSGGEEYGEIAEFTSSNGVKCWGYPVSAKAYDYGYLATSGGSVLKVNSFDIKAISGIDQNAIGLTGNLATFSPATGSMAALIPEDQLTEDMVKNPAGIFKNLFGNDSAVYICGVYSTGSS